jgi:RNA polymerase sigma-70 factor (ECF subfamily)
MEKFSDNYLLQQIKNGDHSAFDILFDRYWKKLYQSALARVSDKEAAQDIVQELFIKLWDRRAALDVRTSLENYLFSAVRFSVISYYRSKKATEANLQSALDRMDILEESIHSLSDYLELEKILQDAVDQMPEMLKRVYQLRSESLSIKEISDEVGLADQTVKNYLTEASRRLRITVAEKCPEKHLTYMALLAILLHK